MIAGWLRGRGVGLGVALLVLGGLGTPPVLAWGPRGHRTVARIAQERLSAEASEAIGELLDDGETLIDLANWADREAYDLPAYRDSGPWHYVNVPLEATRYTDRYCKRGDCVVAKIRQYRKLLANRQAPRGQRRDALRFFIHFVADVHQPLHVGDNDDRGGNNTQVQFFGEGTNLHRLWDSGLIEHTRDNDRAWAERVRRRIPAEQVKRWIDAPVEDWATESLEIARTAYEGVRPGARLEAGSRLGTAYFETHLPTVERRLAQASVRLAHELNEMFR